MGETNEKLRLGSIEMIKVILVKLSQSNSSHPQIFVSWIYPIFKSKWSEKFFVSILQFIEKEYPEYYRYLIVPSEWNGGAIKKFPDLHENDGSKDPPAAQSFYIESQPNQFIHPEVSPFVTPLSVTAPPSPVRFSKEIVTLVTNAGSSLVICPRCCATTPHPPLKQKERLQCSCGYTIFALDLPVADEKDKQATIQMGTARQKTLLDVYLRHTPSCTAHERSASDSLDYTIMKNGGVDHYLEIKERTNTLNTFPTTRITLHKMEVAQRLFRKTEKETYILIKFIDCWARYRVDPNRNYTEGAILWGRNDRPTERMQYVDIPLTDLTILDWDELLEL